jgi:PIN domain nuclease of toxin-antitoxin system
MRLLVDTHTFLWFVAGDPALSRTARALLDDPGNDLLLSIASPWEVAVKVGTGKLTVGRPVNDFFALYLPKTRTALLPVSLDHVGAVATLPRHHGDPFDRLIISQAMVENIAIVSVDAEFDAYPIVRRW